MAEHGIRGRGGGGGKGGRGGEGGDGRGGRGGEGGEGGGGVVGGSAWRAWVGALKVFFFLTSRQPNGGGWGTHRGLRRREKQPFAISLTPPAGVGG